jgi:uncharacterized protein (DUF2141 family)
MCAISRRSTGCTVLLGALLLSPNADAESSPAEVRLAVSVAAKSGRVLCALYQRGGWLKLPFAGTTAKIASGVAGCRFDAVKPGRYGIVAFHDENRNGTLDKNWIGVPVEPWCASRDARGTFGPPKFEDAAFTVATANLNLACSAY